MSDEVKEVKATRETGKLRSVLQLSCLLTLRIEEAAALSNLSVRQLKAAIKARKLKSITVGDKPRIRRTDLDTFVAQL